MTNPEPIYLLVTRAGLQAGGEVGRIRLGTPPAGAPPCDRCGARALLQAGARTYCGPCTIQLTRVAHALHNALDEIETEDYLAAEEAPDAD